MIDAGSPERLAAEARLAERTRVADYLRALALDERARAAERGGDLGARFDVAASALQRAADAVEAGEHLGGRGER